MLVAASKIEHWNKEQLVGWPKKWRIVRRVAIGGKNGALTTEDWRRRILKEKKRCRFLPLNHFFSDGTRPTKEGRNKMTFYRIEPRKERGGTVVYDLVGIE